MRGGIHARVWALANIRLTSQRAGEGAWEPGRCVCLMVRPQGRSAVGGTRGALTDTLGSGCDPRDTCVCVRVCARVHASTYLCTGGNGGELGSMTHRMDCVSNLSYWMVLHCVCVGVHKDVCTSSWSGSMISGLVYTGARTGETGTQAQLLGRLNVWAWLLESFTLHGCGTCIFLNQSVEQDEAIGAGCVPVCWSGWAAVYILVYVLNKCVCVHVPSGNTCWALTLAWPGGHAGAAVTLPLWGCRIQQPLTLRTFKWQLSTY